MERWELRITLLLLIITWGLILLNCMEKNDKGEPEKAELISYSYTGCINKILEHSDTAEVEIITETEVAPLFVTILHKNAIFNCCPDTILVEVSQSQDTLRIIEKEVIERGGCDCTCLFKVKIRIKVPSRGIYILEIWNEGFGIVYKRKIRI